MKIIKKYIVNKLVVYSLILVLIVLFSAVPTNNKNFNVEINEDENNYEENVVYLLDDDNYVSRVISYFDNNGIKDEIKSKIDILINGDSSLKSFYSLIPKGTILKNIKVDKDTVYLDFNKDILNVNEYVEESMIEGIIYTLTEINGINNVYIMVDGKLLEELPNSKKKLDYPLTRNYGINKKYDINSFNDIDKTTIFFAKSNDDQVYYVPVTKVSNVSGEKIDIIIEELKSSVYAQDNLNSFIPNNVELVSSNVEDNRMNLVFNNYIFSDNNILEEVKFLVSKSIFENYNVDEITFNTEKDKNIDRIKRY
ncbi:MAG: GerMN domain-containing protein [Bacilli bacterium]|nr:GerMN domain-containing protein [Bacilli bacterium]